MGYDRRLTFGAVPAAVVAGGLATTLIFGGAKIAPVTAQSAAKITAEQRDTATSLQAAFMKIADTVSPATVYITVKAEASGGGAASPFSPDGGDSPFGDLFGPGNPFNRAPGPGGRALSSSGSGVIVRQDGYILTNDHVVARAKNGTVTVHLSDGTEYSGKIFRDQRSDLAVVKINAPKPLPFVRFADSSKLRVGQWAIAIGSPFGEQNTMTTGIVSALNRKSEIGNGTDARYYPELIQTDASINPGNSGGPLLDIDGQLIGVNVAIESPSGTNAGIGFAIPANTAQSIMTQLITKGKVVRASLGLVPKDISPRMRASLGLEKGARVYEVKGDSAADKAGIRAGDVITSFNGKEITNEVSLRNAISSSAPGSQATIGVRRQGGKIETLTATLAAPDDTTVPTPVPAPAQRPTNRLGFQPGPLTEEVLTSLGMNAGTKGIVVSSVAPGSPAAEAGLRAGAVITAVNGVVVTTPAALSSATSSARSGDVITLTILLRGQSGEKPSEAVVDISVP
ncbi:MAG: trypsin-like peptidase domain-containing protein [Armatimonadota bacterium]